MTCVERLVEIFGSQADVARAFQLDRAVVHHWVKTGYIPARWAGEVERVTQARISALEVINEASVKNPVRVKSRPDDAPFGILSESDPMSQFTPSQAHPVLPSAAAHADGARAHRDPSARAHHHEPAGDRLSRSGVRRDDGRAEVAAALRLPDEEPAHLPALRPGLGRHGVLLRQHGGAGRQGHRLPERRVRRSHARERRCAAAARPSWSRTSGASRSTRRSSRTR